MLGGGPIRALAIISFPVRPGDLEVYDELDLGSALEEIGRAIRTGRHDQTGTVIVPYQERRSMKVDMELRHGGGKGQGGRSGLMWEFHMKYHTLPANYAMEIASLAASFAAFVSGIAGGASSSDPAYEVTFSYDAEEAMPKGVEKTELGALFKGKAEAVTLLYSQAVGMQDAGIELLKRLNESAQVEIKAGQRK